MPADQTGLVSPGGPTPEATSALADLVVTAAGLGTFDWDLVTGHILWDPLMLELLGIDAATPVHTIEEFDARVVAEDLPRVRRAVAEAIAGCGEYEHEYRVLLPDGTTRWVSARGRVLCDTAGAAVRMVGVAFDATARRDGEARVARVLEAIPTAFFALSRDWTFTYVNAAAERLLARSREELLGGDLWELFPAAPGSEFETSYRRAMGSADGVTFEAHYPEPLDAWYEVHATPTPDGLSVYFLDVTERRKAQEEEDRAVRRAMLTANVTARLADTLDAEEAVGRLAQLVVPVLADWCVITLVDDTDTRGSRRTTRDVGSWHVAADQRAAVARYAQVRLRSLRPSAFLLQALDSGEVVQIREGATEAIRSVLSPGEAQDLLAGLGPTSATVLPLRARGRTLGAISLFNGGHRRPLTARDLVTAGEVAAAAGLALDNARLYRQQRHVAEGLQRSLLTEPPEPDHVEIVVRYEPAAEAAKVGGDWYDAFLQPDGATVLVIGDVVGHDITAAAAMGQVRSLLRGIAVATGVGPADLLGHVDRALRTLQVRTMATAVVARIEQTEDERERGVTHVRWSNAGHPYPMAINPDGTVVVLSGLHPDPLLGILPDSRRIDSEVVLDRGSTVLLYTDGLVERRDQGLLEGMAHLRDALEQLAPLDLPLDELCDRVLERLRPSRPDDDIALVAVRLHRQDRPRPAEAGPNNVPPDVPDPGPQAGAGEDPA